MGSVQRRPLVGRPSDRYEQEANVVAQRVREGRRAPSISRLGPGGLAAQRQDEEDEERVQAQALSGKEEDEEDQTMQKQPKEDEEEPVQAQSLEDEEEETAVQKRSSEAANPAGVATRALQSKGRGRPMHPPTRRTLERRMGADLSQVRIHDDPGDRAVAREMNAKAFTNDSDIWLGPGASDRNVELMAHEATHVVQQGATEQAHTGGAASPAVQRQPVEEEEESVQRNLASSAWNWTTSAAYSAARTVADTAASAALSAAAAIVPGWVVDLIREIRKKGIIGMLKDRLGEAMKSMFGGLPEQTGFLKELTSQFGRVLSTGKALVQDFLQGGCQAIFDAIGDVKDFLTSLAEKGWKKLKEFFEPIATFFTDLWNRLGTPIVEWIEDVGGEVWDALTSVWSYVQSFANHLGSLASQLGSKVWGTIKGWLGFSGGTSEEGSESGAITSWVTDQLDAAWDWVEDQLDPVISPIKDAVSSVSSFYQDHVVGFLQEKIDQFEAKFAQVGEVAGGPNDVVANQDRLREAILPGVLGVIDSVRGVVARIGPWVNGLVSSLIKPVKTFFANVQEVNFLPGVGGMLKWIQDGVDTVSTWANETVSTLLDVADRMLVQVKGFVRPVFETLKDVAAVLGDFVGSIKKLISGLWTEIPSCLRDVLKTFLVDQILKRLPFFNQLKNAKKAFEKIRETVMTALYQVFVDGDLLGAAWTIFRAMLKAVGIPPEMVTALVKNAAKAFSSIFRDPIGFLINMARSVQRGFGLFFANIQTHLLGGLTDWLFGALKKADIDPPQSLALSEIFRFVFEVLGLSVEKVIRKVAEKAGVSKDRIDRMVERINQVIEVAGQGLRWIQKVVTQGPAALWEFLKQKLTGLWQTVRKSIVAWINRKVIQAVAKKAALMLDPTGIGAVINIVTTIWDAVTTFAEKVKELIGMVNTVFQGATSIAKGVLEKAAGFVESALVRGLPIAITFLAKWGGFSNLPGRIGEMIKTVRSKVDNALDWLAGKTVGAVRRGLSALRKGASKVKEGAKKLVDWWTQEEKFSAGGEDHRLFFEGKRKQATLMVASSTPQPLEAFIKKRKSDVTGEKDDQLDDILTKVEKVDSIKTRSGKRSKSSFGKSDGEEIAELLDEIADLLAKSGYAESERPPSQVEFETIEQTINDAGETSEDAKEMNASVLSIRPADNATGSQPTQKSNLWDRVRQRRGAYVRGHLLNHHVHGPGRTDNLTPITASANTSMLSAVEETVKDEVLSENNVVSYHVEAHYGARDDRTHIPEEEKIPTHLSFNVKPLTTKDETTGEDPDDWVEDSERSLSYTSSVKIELPPDTPPEEGGGTPRFETIALNDTATSDETLITALQTVDGIGPSLATSIVRESVIEGPSRGNWTELEQIKNIRGIGPETVAALTSDSRVQLGGRTVKQSP